MRSSNISVMLFVALLSWCLYQRNVLGGAYLRPTNVKCKSFDKAFVEFRFCRLIVLRRGVIALKLYAQVHQLPVNNISVNLSLWKRANGYRPFLYNTTADFCDFMANRKRYPFLKIFFDIMAKDTNVNHTCPYNHDIIVTNLTVTDTMMARIPLPSDDYMINLKVAVDNDWKADFKSYFTRTEEF